MTTNVNVPIQCSQSEAKAKVVTNISSVKGLTIQPTWIKEFSADLSVSYSGFATSGTIRIDPDMVCVVVQIPRIARRWAPTIEKSIREEMGKILS